MGGGGVPSRCDTGSAAQQRRCPSAPEVFSTPFSDLTPFSLLPFSLPGPICSVCVENFGARPVTIFSGVMVAGGMMLSAFAPNVEFLIFSYGIVVGR